jgi:ABC-type transport system substrate-binding protein
LFRQGPDLNPWPDLAENMVTETHSDNSAVPDGHTRFTIDIIKNATWSDGVPLTAADVAFTFNYQFESGEYGNPAAIDYAELYAVYTPNPFRVVLEFSTESYWHFSNFAYDYIIPEHIFNDETGIGYEGWNTWNPVFNSSAPHVTCGPFRFEDYEDNEFYELLYNPLFHYSPGYTPMRPYISPTDFIAYYYGTTGHEIVWSTWGTSCDSYSIFMNGTLRESGSWTSGDIRHSIDDLAIGTYVFELAVNDTRGYSATDTLFVYVSEPGFFQSSLSVLAISISSLSSVVILVLIVQIYRNKRFQEDS